MAGWSHKAAATWQDEGFARTWAQQDSLRDMLDFPRRIAAAVVADDNPDPGLVVDVASGPGDFLAVFLEEFPAARGLWTDVSPAMRDLAGPRLAEFGDRVDFLSVDMTDLSAVPDGLGLIICSRASHHLDRPALLRFYAEAAAHLTPGGWLVNLDHTDPGEPWNGRLRTARKRFRLAGSGAGSADGGAPHHHDHPSPTVQDHLDGFAGAGLTDVQLPWRAFVTCLFMGRKDG
jgi:SAM-dependent methyltransferase